MTVDAARRARGHVLDEHAALLTRLGDCADRVAAAWETPPTDRAAVVEPLRAVLTESGALDALPGLLGGAVEAAGYELQASPVAAPPYVAVTSIGPVCRATVADGRLVVTFELFELDRSGVEPTYHRRDCPPEESVEVELRD
ncbi:hypothetical protein [Haloarchaeobius litoreus]|uniref:DUF7988 domain-containing protein n=1 Tax=Haloarchaeobius litoreus TaxID=755306 RepID=A0ABD6DL26_9EURY|nr:hypothetical protein [Haloarchaeobius litoreus]